VGIAGNNRIGWPGQLAARASNMREKSACRRVIRELKLPLVNDTQVFSGFKSNPNILIIHDMTKTAG